MTSPTGQYLRRGHRCELPASAVRGDIWRCDCGRRWIYTLGIYDYWWKRRRWPWPRLPKEAPR